MKTLLLRLRQKIETAGSVSVADLDRVQAYARKHPMWAVCAGDDVRAAYAAVVACARETA